MDLWIKSQNKKVLCRATNLKVGKSPFIDWCIYNGDDELGVYESEERALQVLDEIQALFIPKFIIKNSGWRKGNPYLTEVFPVDNDIECENIESYVYEMPKE